MSYIALYRKYRPQSLRDVVGQKPVVQTLVNALERGQIHHAYLFCGPRGTGKTSVARALALSVNCSEGPTPDPCGKCVSCQRNREGNSLDVIEIDAASNRGIDEIRALKGSVSFSPTEGQYKVYIIDEVHMLTKGAFNAFLKTLEDPPAGVIFILATTEPHQVLPTILSRCQRFDFRLHTHKDLVDRLQYICEQEDVAFETQALKAIAFSAQGGLRDAISTLDQVISFAQETIREEEVYELLGKVDRRMLREVVNAIIKGDTPRLLEMLGEVEALGKDPQQLLGDIVQFLHQVLLFKECGPETRLLQLPEEEKPVLEQMSSEFNREDLLAMLQISAGLEREMKFSSHPYMLLEMLGVRLVALSEETDMPRRLKELEARVDLLMQGSGPVAVKRQAPKQEKKEGNRKTEVIKEKDIEERVEAPKPLERDGKRITLAEIKAKWADFTSFIQNKKRQIRLRGILVDSEPRALEGNKLVLKVKFSFMARQLEEKRDDLEKYLLEFFKHPFSPAFIPENGEEEAPKKTGKKKEPQDRPLDEHPLVQQALELFNGEITDD